MDPVTLIVRAIAAGAASALQDDAKGYGQVPRSPGCGH